MKGQVSDQVGAQPAVLGYVSLCELSPDLFRGGMLLVDSGGKPLDFRCTSAIRPSAIQKVLYGGSLAGHIAIELCGRPLLEAAGGKPAVLLVSQPELMPLRHETDKLVVWLRRQGDLVAEGANGMEDDQEELLASDAGLFGPVLVSSSREFPGNSEAGLNLLRELARIIDPMEPFGRITAALKLVQEKAGGK